MHFREIDALKETLYEKEYPCGLRAYVMPKEGYQKKYAMFSTHFGSINDKFVLPETGNVMEVPDGVAHFLEHKLFSQIDGSAMDKFAAMGASSNAYTSFTHTSYLFSCTSGFNDSFKLLLNFVQNPYITDESVENEKGIIGQEIRMYQDDPDWQVYFNFLNCLYNSFPVKKDIAGTIDSISGINRELLYKCFHTFYDLSNMVIFVAGDVDPDEVFKMIEENTNVNKDRLEIETIYPNEEPKINIEFKEVKCDVALPLFMFGFKINNNHEDIIKDEIATNIALEVIAGKSSILYEKLYEEELITSPISLDVTFEKNYSFCAVGGESKDPVTAVTRIKEEIEKIKNGEIPIEIFERVKRRLIGDFIRQFNSIDKIAHIFMSNIFRGADIFEYMDKYNEIDKEYVENIIKKYFSMELSAVSIVKPQ